jgi:hypothetical protein
MPEYPPERLEKARREGLILDEPTSATPQTSVAEGRKERLCNRLFRYLRAVFSPRAKTTEVI